MFYVRTIISAMRADNFYGNPHHNCYKRTRYPSIRGEGLLAEQRAFG